MIRKIFRIALFITIAAILVIFGYGLAINQNPLDQPKQTTMTEPQCHATGTIHPKFEWDGIGIPSLNVSCTKDAKTGYNLVLETSNFTFDPENASKLHIKGHGHAHLYIDGQKITRIYGPYYYLGNLSSGNHQIVVTINSNDHNDYSVGGVSIMARTSVDVP